MSGGEVHPMRADSQTEGESLVCSHWLASEQRIRCRLSGKHYYWQRNMDLWLQCQNSPFIGLEISFIPNAEESLPKFKARQKCLSVFSDQDGVLHHEFAPAGQTVNKECYF
jgi:hypothetical protein